ncbi:MFS transporter [Cognatishimia activa]|uniref:MFS transporter n=1 Tax=Cognatishimia activa TaxID=1715691 RepID=UPI00223296C5|nr:MFS transporter [Cognatishimia activa]UZD91239.1 MFS transporter [Cognatishimia activa]
MQSAPDTPAGSSGPAKLSFPYLSLIGIALICGFGTLYYAFPQIAFGMEEEFGWSKSELYGAMTVGWLFTAATAVPVGLAIDNGHGRNVMTGGAILAGVLFFLWSQTQTQLWLYAVLAGLGILQSATLYSATFAVIAKYFDKSKVRDYITTLTLWGGFASTVFIPFIELLMSYMDWRQTLMVLGAINVLVCAPIYAFLPSGTGTQTEDQDDGESEPQKRDAKWALMQPIFWALLICFALYSVMATSFRTHLYPMLIEWGWSGEDAVFILALLGPAQVAGRALMKVFKTRSIAYVGVFIASMFPLAFLAMILFPHSYPILIVASLAYGAAAGTMTIVKGLSVPEFLTKSSYGLINGMMNTPIAILSAFGPTLAALSWTITGSYLGLMIGMVVVSTAMLMSFIAAAVISSKSR